MCEFYCFIVLDFGCNNEENFVDRNGYLNLVWFYVEFEFQLYYVEIVDVMSKYVDVLVLVYMVKIVKNKIGKSVMLMCFCDFEVFEVFFMDELIGFDLMKGCVLKVIGIMLLIWDCN